MTFNVICTCQVRVVRINATRIITNVNVNLIHICHSDDTKPLNAWKEENEKKWKKIKSKASTEVDIYDGIKWCECMKITAKSQRMITMMKWWVHRHMQKCVLKIVQNERAPTRKKQAKKRMAIRKGRDWTQMKCNLALNKWKQLTKTQLEMFIRLGTWKENEKKCLMKKPCAKKVPEFTRRYCVDCVAYLWMRFRLNRAFISVERYFRLFFQFMKKGKWEKSSEKSCFQLFPTHNERFMRRKEFKMQYKTISFFILNLLIFACLFFAAFFFRSFVLRGPTFDFPVEDRRRKKLSIRRVTFMRSRFLISVFFSSSPFFIVLRFSVNEF